DADTSDAYLTRLTAIPDYLADVADRHRAGVAAGRTPVAHLTRAAIDHVDRYLADPANDLLATQPLDDARAARRERLLADEILPAGRSAERPGVCWLPDGEEIYRTLCRLHTTTDRTPEELHQTGLDVIAALADEYAALGASVFGTTDQREIFARMTDDPA